MITGRTELAAGSYFFSPAVQFRMMVIGFGAVSAAGTSSHGPRRVPGSEARALQPITSRRFSTWEESTRINSGPSFPAAALFSFPSESLSSARFRSRQASDRYPPSENDGEQRSGLRPASSLHRSKAGAGKPRGVPAAPIRPRSFVEPAPHAQSRSSSSSSRTCSRLLMTYFFSPACQLSTRTSGGGGIFEARTMIRKRPSGATSYLKRAWEPNA